MYWSFENVPWTNLHDLNLDWIVNTMKQTVEQWIAYRTQMDADWAEFQDNNRQWQEQIESNFEDLQNFVNNYFNTLDLTTEVRQIINEMVSSGAFLAVIQPTISTETAAWLAAHITTPETVVIDTSLTIAGAAADAKAAGDKIKETNDKMLLSNSYTSADSSWQMGNLVAEQGGARVRANTATNRAMSATRILVNPGDKLEAVCPAGAKYRVMFFATAGALNYNTVYTPISSGLDDVTVWHQENRTITVPNGAVSFAVCLGLVDDNSFSVATRPALNISLSTLGTIVNNLQQTVDGNKIEIAASNNNWQNTNLFPREYETQVLCDTSYTTVCFTDRLNIAPGEQLLFECPSNAKYRCIFFSVTGPLETGISYTPINTSDNDVGVWQAGDRILTVPNTAIAFAVCLVTDDRANITPSTRPSLHIYKISIKTWLSETWSRILTTGNKYSGKKLSILGDSISTFAGDNPTQAADGHWIADGTYTYSGNHCRYPAGGILNVDNTYWYKLLIQLNMTLGVNDSWAGSLVSWDGASGNDKGADIYIASQTRIDHLKDNGTPEIILVQAGTNDIGKNVPIGTFNTDSPLNYTQEEIAALPVDTFADAYRALLIRLQKTYPLAKIIVMLPDYTTSYYNPKNADQYLEIIKEACDYFGVPWVDMRTNGINIYNTATYLYDGIHPNISGMNLIYEELSTKFKYSF